MYREETYEELKIWILPRKEPGIKMVLIPQQVCIGSTWRCQTESQLVSSWSWEGVCDEIPPKRLDMQWPVCIKVLLTCNWRCSPFHTEIWPCTETLTFCLLLTDMCIKDLLLLIQGLRCPLVNLSQTWYKVHTNVPSYHIKVLAN